MTLPNLLTLLRIFAVPFIVYYIYIGEFKNALFYTAVASITDFLDGFLARRFRSYSALGAFLDPFADRLMMTSVFVVLTLTDHIPLHFFLLLFLRDLTVGFGYHILKKRLETFTISPLLSGKIATALQMLYASFIMVNNIWPYFYQLVYMLYVSTLIMTFISLYFYFKIFKQYYD